MKYFKIPYLVGLITVFFYFNQNILGAEDLFSSALGLSGAILTPSPYTKKLEESSIAWYGHFYDEYDTSTLKYANATRHWLSLSSGVTDNIEFAFLNQSFTGASNKRTQNYMNFKYQAPVESIPMAVSLYLPTSSKEYSSLLVSFGWSQFYFGAGTNYGGRRLIESGNGVLNDYGTSLFGGYRLRSVLVNRNNFATQSLIEGKPEPLFGFAGGQVPLGNNFQLLYDYNGDAFAAGFRLSLDTTTFQINWLSESDYDKLYDRKNSNIVAAAQYKF